MRPLSLLSSGIVCSVGLDAPTACAAIRCGISGASESHFVDEGGEPLVSCRIPLDDALEGVSRLVAMAGTCVGEAMRGAAGIAPEEVPVLLCVAEKDRPGRLADLDAELLAGVRTALKGRLHADSQVIPAGRAGIGPAVQLAERLVHEKKRPACILAGVDSLLPIPTLTSLQGRGRLLTSKNSNGFIPGEAAAAVLVAARSRSPVPELVCRGFGSQTEAAIVESDEPLRAEGMTRAIRAALDDGKATFDEIDYRLADLSGEQYGFKEAALAMGRILRRTKMQFDLWHPADSVGEVGAATGPLLLGVALTAFRKGYAPGRGVLVHLSGDEGSRIALVLTPPAGKS